MDEPTHVQVYGKPNAAFHQIQTALSEYGEFRHFCFEHKARGNEAGQPFELSDIIKTGLILYFLDGDEKWSDSLRHLKHVINCAPYIPIVVIGRPARHTNYIHKLGVSRLLSWKADPATIAREASRAYRATWWSAVRSFDIPTLVVDRDFHIVRANLASIQRFGERIIGENYAVAVEDSLSLSSCHPIRAAFARGEGIAEYHEFQANTDVQRTNLVCTPVPGLKGTVRAVAVQVFEMRQWPKIFKSISSFLEAENLEQLCNELVSKVTELNYTRVRLYKYDSVENRMKGYASSGFSTVEKANEFTSFSFKVDEDPPSKHLVQLCKRQKALPFLCKYKSETETDPNEDRVVRYYKGEPLYQEELERDSVYSWIEVPLIVPVVEPPNKMKLVLWGKLSVDRGKESGDLNARDVADLTMFATIACSSLAATLRNEEERHHLRLFRDYSRRMSDCLSSVSTARKVLPEIRKVLLDLFMEITDAEVVYYRNLHRQSLQFEGNAKWKTPAFGQDNDIPPAVRAGEGICAELFNRLDSRGKLKVPGTSNSEMVTLVSRSKDDTPRSADFESQLRSTICLPVVVHGDSCRGAIIAGSRQSGRFREGILPKLHYFLYMANQWTQLGERLDEQVWWDKILKDIVDVLPLIKDAPNEEQFLAGLAALLTSHVGLGWNRIMIFRTMTKIPDTGQLAYALGGLGRTETEHAEHRQVQHSMIDRFDSLRAIVDHAIENPVPTYEGRHDGLYSLVIHEPRVRSRPIQIQYGPKSDDARHDLSCPDALRWMLRRKEIRDLPDRPGNPDLQIPLIMQNESWLQAMNAVHPGMFSADITYAYPLWSECHFQSEPLGLVLVDMAYMPEKGLDMTVSATRVVLDLVADILAMRERERREYGRLGRFMSQTHLSELEDAAQSLAYHLEMLPSDLSNTTKLRERLKSINQESDAIVSELKKRSRLVNDTDPHQQSLIPDLGAYLSQLRELVNTRELRHAPREVPRVHLEGDWADVTGMALRCDPMILDDTFVCLLHNAWKAAYNFAKLELFVLARRFCCPGDAFKEVAEIKVWNSGPPINSEIAKYVFMNGFSHRSNSPSSQSVLGKSNGRGLAIARSQLFAYHGDLQLVAAGPTEHPITGKPMGPCFSVIFGIPRDEGT